MTKTITVWKGEERFRSQHENHFVDIDGNRKDGFGAKALLLAGLAACSGIDIVEILQKMRVEFSDFEILTQAEQTETHPRVFKDIFIQYQLKTDAVNEEKVRKAIVLSLDKYCGVSAMLKKNSPIHYKLRIL